uniref:EamA domain-containing protein n=1 Tax=Haptolina brevifila TaxID=156173 RepID=A0A7S2HMI5_9EUKA|mmetsp:Transcript_56178/g.111537  ORF Transcript_56178/g.111537 Transcript_56178/m.111537 type:complete len:369 (+) Transcript_56178:152-1258(+)
MDTAAICALLLIVAASAGASLYLRRRANPLALSVMAATWFSVMALSAKLASTQSEVSPTVNQACRGYVGWVIVCLDLWQGGKRLCPSVGGSKLAPWLLFARVLFGMLAMLLYFVALGDMNVGDATAVYMTYPLWTVLLAACTGRTKSTCTLMASCGMCFIGVLLISQPEALLQLFDNGGTTRRAGSSDVSAGDSGTALAALTMLGSGVSMALGIESLGRLGSHCTLDPRQVVHAFFATTAVAGTAVVLLSGESLSFGWTTWLLLLVCGAAGYGAQFCTAAAVLSGNNNAAFALIQNLELVLTYAYQVLIFHEPLESWQALGALLIAFGVVVVKVPLVTLIRSLLDSAQHRRSRTGRMSLPLEEQSAAA